MIDKYRLRLKEFESTVCAEWRGYQTQKDFSDVTLTCGNGEIEAHKFILSASSPVFKTIFKQNLNQHPLIFIEGINQKNLEDLLKFIYHGQVSIDEEDLDRFLDLAKDLKIRGLTEESINRDDALKLSIEGNSAYDKREGVPNSNLGGKEINYFENIVNKREEVTKWNLGSNETNYFENINNKREVVPKWDLDNKINSFENIDYRKEEVRNWNIGENNINSFENIVDKVEENNPYEVAIQQNIYQNSQQDFDTLPKEKVYSCEQCDKHFRYSHVLTRHIRSIHQGASFPCGQCDKTFNQIDNLRQHKAAIHDGIRYKCDHCDFTASTKYHLRSHRQKRHNLH